MRTVEARVKNVKNNEPSASAVLSGNPETHWPLAAVRDEYGWWTTGPATLDSPATWSDLCAWLGDDAKVTILDGS